MAVDEFEYVERVILGGVQRRYAFANGYGASVVRHPYSYGGSEGLWELAVIGIDGALTYDTLITDDVIGHLTWDEVGSLLKAIAALARTE